MNGDEAAIKISIIRELFGMNKTISDGTSNK